MLRRLWNTFNRNTTTEESFQYTTTHTKRKHFIPWSGTGEPLEILRHYETTTGTRTSENENDQSRFEVSTTNVQSWSTDSDTVRQYYAEVKTSQSHFYIQPEENNIWKNTSNYEPATSIVDTTDCLKQMRDIVKIQASNETTLTQQQLIKTFSFFMCKDRQAHRTANEVLNHLGGKEQRSATNLI